MDIYTRLKQDHDERRNLAKQIMKTSGDSEERRQLWHTFKPEALAQQAFYATLIEQPDTQEQARHNVSEHKEADDLIKELSDMAMSSSGWIQKFEKLKDELEHHMDEEEKEVFKKAKKVITEAQALPRAQLQHFGALGADACTKRSICFEIVAVGGNHLF